MPKEAQKYKAQRSKITATLADKLKAQKKSPRPGDKGPRYNVNRLWDTEFKGFILIAVPVAPRHGICVIAISMVENRPIRLEGIQKSPYRQPGEKL